MDSLCPTTAPVAPAGFDALFHWAAKRQANVEHVCVAENARGIKGVFATKDFEPGEQIIHIPGACMLTAENARASAIGQALSAANISDESDHAYLAMFMLADRASHISRWHYYYNTLPQEFASHPLFYPKSQLERLSGSSALEIIYRRRYALQRSYQGMCDALEETFSFSLDDYQVARTLINTRSFSVAVNGTEQAVMVPVIDMINHGDLDCTYRDIEGDGYSVWATKPIAKGQEITHSYGAKSLQRYFANYGFIREFTRDDECRVVIRLNPDCPSLTAKMQALALNEPVMELILGQDINQGIAQAMPALILAIGKNFAQGQVVHAKRDGGTSEAQALALLKVTLKNRLACYQVPGRLSDTSEPMIAALLQREHKLLQDYLKACG